MLLECSGAPQHRRQFNCTWLPPSHTHCNAKADIVAPPRVTPRISTHQTTGSAYWPGIDNDIDNIVLSCKKCQDMLPANTKEPLISKPKPTRPFQEVAADFCCYGGQNYLILVDCFTDWPDIIPMGHNTTTTHLIKALRQSFCRTAIPDVLWSDEGPQFTSKAFQDFTKQWGFTHQTSSPYHPQSNGKIKATVKSMKKIIATSWNISTLDESKLCYAILQYRNTPSRRDELSPAQKLYGTPV